MAMNGRMNRTRIQCHLGSGLSGLAMVVVSFPSTVGCGIERGQPALQSDKLLHVKQFGVVSFLVQSVAGWHGGWNDARSADGRAGHGPLGVPRGIGPMALGRLAGHEPGDVAVMIAANGFE